MRCVFIVAILLALLGCKETILHDLNEREANKIRLTLGDFGIAVDKLKSASNWDIEVERGEAKNALKILEYLRLPKYSKVAGSSSSFISSKQERDIIWEKQLTFDIENTLSEIPGVIDSRVHIVFDHASPTGAAKGVSGSILLFTLNGATVNLNQVKELVAGAAAISKENLAILLAPLSLPHRKGEKKHDGGS